ncbi:MAG TPA: DUF6600 domain-containing protein, partial [Terracidiphilus sp.]|nr:DUF6600 domain-containing protein [Terracidiphilus sp.]
TLRLGPDTEVVFPTLDRLGTGATVSAVHVLRGMVYVSLVKTKGNQFDLLFGNQKLALPPESHVRLDVTATNAQLAVLGGTVPIQEANGVENIGRKRTVTFDLVSPGPATVADKVEAAATDTWDKNAADYHERVATMSAFGNAPYAYGMNDMAYYGSFADAGGCGMMWRPYFASASWDPYGAGVWAWYGGAGYSWVSPYPWGWMPYHYGSWVDCPGSGWGWMPGGAWNGIANTGEGIAATGLILGTHHLTPPKGPPRAGALTLRAVNLQTLVHSGMTSRDSFAFRRDSAGMGIPREGLGSLRGLSRHADEHGLVSTPVYESYGRTMMSRGIEAGSAVAVVSMHRGYAPMAMSSGATMEGGHGEYSGGGSISSGSSASAPSMSMSGGHSFGGGGGGGSVGGGGARR